MCGARGGPLERALSALAWRSQEEVKSGPGLHSQTLGYPLPVFISFVAPAETPHTAALGSWLGEVGLFADSVDSPCYRSVEWKHPTFADCCSEDVDTHRRPTKLRDKILQLLPRKKETACFFPSVVYSWIVK